MQSTEDTFLSSIIMSLAERVCELEDENRNFKNQIYLLEKQKRSNRRIRRPLTSDKNNAKIWKPDLPNEKRPYKKFDFVKNK